MPEVSVKEIMAFFGMTAGEFTKEWRQLSETDKEQIKSAFRNGSLTY